MKSTFKILLLTIITFSLNAQNTVNFSYNDSWVGYMNWYDLGGNYVSGSPWGIADLKATPDSATNSVTLQPNYNVYDSTNAYWVNQTTFQGEKLMEASCFVEPGATFNGVDLTFEGSVSSNTIDPAYDAKAFIKALDPAAGYTDALAGSGTIMLPASGNFSITVPASSLAAGLIVQYGFSVYGVNANPVNEANLGSVVVTAASTTTSTSKLVNEQVEIFPNPVNDVLNIKSNTLYDQISILNLQGQLLKNFSSNTNSIDLSDLPSGTYIIELTNGSNKTIQKFNKI
jgi:hypothetical protein